MPVSLQLALPLLNLIGLGGVKAGKSLLALKSSSWVFSDSLELRLVHGPLTPEGGFLPGDRAVNICEELSSSFHGVNRLKCCEQWHGGSFLRSVAHDTAARSDLSPRR